MLLPLSLLKSFLPLSASLAEVEETLTLLGLEVDKIHQKSPPFSAVFCVEITAVKPHPESSSLSLVDIDDGKAKQQVVCGAKNCRPGMRAPFASADAGAVLYGAQGKEIRIQGATIRGIFSPGMLCSAAELGIAGSGEEILELPSSIEKGADLLELLWDPVLEISLTPNLGHCLSALGVARELSAAWKLPLLPFSPLKASSLPASPFSIEIEAKEACSLYRGQKVEGVSAAPSPFWLQQTLLKAGMTPRNTLVDITNYILLKWGQPLHAFDADALEGDTLFIKTLEAPTPFTGLDGETKTLPAGALCICDRAGPAALAGILGGARTAVRADTQNVFLEAASFSPEKIRSTAKALGFRTESALRFEKGVDPSILSYAFSEALSLLCSIGKGTINTGPAEAKVAEKPPLRIRCRVERASRLLGVRLSFSEAQSLLERLGCSVAAAGKDAMEVTIPPHRFDLGEEIDLIEEIARLYGLGNIEKKEPLYRGSSLPDDPLFVFEGKVRTAAAGQGLQETLTSDLISPKLASLWREKEGIELLSALHAKTEEYSILRPSLFPGMLQTAERNFAQKNKDLAFFELGKIHFLAEKAPVEIPMLALFLTGQKNGPHWSGKSPAFDFYDLKGILENLFTALSIPRFALQPSRHPSFHPERQADLFCHEAKAGSFGEIHPRFGLPQRAYFAEIDLALLLPLQATRRSMRPLPQYPGSERDLTLPASAKSLVQTYFDAALALKEPRLEKMTLLDVYYPPESTQKNLTFRFSYRDPTRTLSFEEVEALHKKVCDSLFNLV